MSEFTKSYGALNNGQREAVDKIEGALLVLAGPGTGKTQLLSTRVANILSKTDSDPRNILCLTYTEAGATEMRDRLAKIIGVDGYQVGVFTFHGFALEVFRRFDQFFLDRPRMEPIDELRRYELLLEVLGELPVHYKLRHKNFSSEHENIEDLSSKVADLKSAGLSPGQAIGLVESNDKAMDGLQDALDIMPASLPRSKAGKKELIEQYAEYMSRFANQFLAAEAEQDDPKIIKNLGDLLAGSLARAVAECDAETSDLAPLKDWRDHYLEKDGQNKWIFKDRKYNNNLTELSKVYEIYQKKLDENGLLEFDDMIFGLLDKMRSEKALLYNMQELWQYILIDEFQDTNPAQLEIIKLLGARADGEVPNIMAVGDDDQAIFAFQGADVTNIQSFIELWPGSVDVITLEDNYRSSKNILAASGYPAGMIIDRPTGTAAKELQGKSNQPKVIENKKVELHVLNTEEAEISWVVNDIKEKINSGEVAAEDIAVISPKHQFLIDLSTILHANAIPLSYEKNSNILEDEIILNIVNLAELVLAIANGRVNEVAALLPEVLSDSYWGLPTEAVWKLSIETRKINSEIKQTSKRKDWLEVLGSGEVLVEQGKIIHQQLMFWASKALNLSLEQMLDLLIGVTEHGSKSEEAASISPFKEYYFRDGSLDKNPAAYANFLSSLSALREGLRAYYTDRSASKLVDLVNYVRMAQNYGGLKIKRKGLHLKSAGVNLMTAYSAKGLEFENVYLIHCLDNVWSESARGKTDNLLLTSNFGRRKDSADDKTRLFYVAQTRAKSRLVHSLYKFDAKGKEKVMARYIVDLKSDPKTAITVDTTDEVLSVEDSSEAYEQKLFGGGLGELFAGESSGGDPKELSITLGEILRPRLEGYRLSVTNLNKLLDEQYGGPEKFILQCLLNFPSARTASSVHGTAIHRALELAAIAKDKFKDAGALKDFLIATYESEIIKSEIDVDSIKAELSKAESIFERFSDEILTIINGVDKAEMDIKVNFGEARLSGKIDALTIVESADGVKEVVVTDYKTGKPAPKYSPKEKQFKNQLYFYRLLLELSYDRLPKGAKVARGEIVYLHPSLDSLEKLSVDYSNTKSEAEYKAFKIVVTEAWEEIMALGEA